MKLPEIVVTLTLLTTTVSVEAYSITTYQGLGGSRVQACSLAKLSAQSATDEAVHGRLIKTSACQCGKKDNAGGPPQWRCLVEAKSEVGGDATLIFADTEATEEGGEDPDVFPLGRGRSGMEVDLRPALREQWLLEAPAFVLCRPDCKGLCLTCGANLNLGACSCAQNTKE